MCMFSRHKIAQAKTWPAWLLVMAMYHKIPIWWLSVSHQLPAWISEIEKFITIVFFFQYKTLSNDIGTNRISVAINATPTNMSLYCTTSKRTLLQWHIISIDPPDIMFVEFFCEKYLPVRDNCNTHPPTSGADKTPNEKLHINELRPNVCILATMWLSIS